VVFWTVMRIVQSTMMIGPSFPLHVSSPALGNMSHFFLFRGPLTTPTSPLS